MAVGPAIIPFTVLDSGMLRSYRGKDRWSQHCERLRSRCLPALNSGALFLSFALVTLPPKLPAAHGLKSPRHSSDDWRNKRASPCQHRGNLLFSGQNDKCVPGPKFLKDGGNLKGNCGLQCDQQVTGKLLIAHNLSIRKTVLASKESIVSQKLRARGAVRRSAQHFRATK